MLFACRVVFVWVALPFLGRGTPLLVVTFLVMLVGVVCEVADGC